MQTTSLPPTAPGARPGWAELYDWRVDRNSETPLFRQVYDQLRAVILARTLRPGTRLPSTRALAARLGIARASVLSAFEQLLAEGYVCGKIGSGTYIAADLPEPMETGGRDRATPALTPRAAVFDAVETFVRSLSEPAIEPFNTGRCRVDARSLALWRKLSLRACRVLDPVHLGYSDPRGLPALRLAICDYLRAARGVRSEPEQIVVTAGTQHAIGLAIRVLLRPGDEAWVEDPGYPVTTAALEAAQIRVRPIPVDTQGLDVGAGIRLAPKARAVFVTPSHQFPLGMVLSMARRLELLAWARKAGAFIIEDDYQSEFRYTGRPLASLQGLDDAERVIYVGTFNKALFPGLRIGYAVLPPALLKDFIRARFLTDRQPPTLVQAILAEFMREGHLSAHIRRTRLAYREQRDTLAAALTRHAGDAVELAVAEQGMHMVAFLTGGRVDVDIEKRARAQGVVARAVSPLYRTAPPRSGLLLGFSGHSRQAIVPAAARLAQVLREAPPRRRAQSM